MTSKVRRVGAVGLALGLGLGALSSLPAHADTTAAPAVPVGGLLGTVDGGLLGGLVGGLLNGQGGVFGPDGGVFAGDDSVGDVVGGLAGGLGGDETIGGSMEVVGAVTDSLGAGNIGGEGSFAGPAVGSGLLGGVLGGLLGGGTGLLGGVF